MTKGYKTGGRQLGTPNKATLESRLALSALINDNLDKLTQWLDEVAGAAFVRLIQQRENLQMSILSVQILPRPSTCLCLSWNIGYPNLRGQNL